MSKFKLSLVDGGEYYHPPKQIHYPWMAVRIEGSCIEWSTRDRAITIALNEAEKLAHELLRFVRGGSARQRRRVK